MDAKSQISRDQLIAELLDAVIDLEPDARRAHLEGATDDPDVIRRVIELIEGESDSEKLLDNPLMTTMDLDLDALEQAREQDTKEPIRRTIGHYTLEEVLGEGGMGRVYLAYQKEPIQRQVALKIMRHGLSSSADEARFDAERRSLARLSHPNIAQMFEAGSTDDGKLFFAMELVRGKPITRYCDSNNLDIYQRLHIFMDVLLAVQHAHQRQLLHRDLKPSNILVAEIDNIPLVKVIDFGISLGIDEALGEARQKGQRAGTPGYSSPESLEPGGDDLGLDTRADVYTLGIVLYELVCGRRPFDEPGDSMEEVWRKINEDTPLHPAQQITAMATDQAEGIAAVRNTRPARLAKTLSSDLDAIIMKAIARDREARYPTVAAFHDDLLNYLDRKPVNAHPQDFTYVANLFVQRHLGLVGAGLLLVVALLLGLIAWSGEARRANLEAERANREALAAQEALSESRELANFMTSLFQLTGEATGTPERMTTEELLAVGANNLDNMDALDPIARARLRQLLGGIYRDVYMLDEAERMFLDALETRRELLGPNHPDVAESMGQLASVYRTRMSYEEAEPMLLEALQIARNAQPRKLEVTADLWSRLGELYRDQSRLDEAVDAYERALEIRELEMSGLDDRALADSQYDLGLINLDRGQFADAEVYFAQATDLYRRVLGNSQRTANALENLAAAEEELGQLEEAEVHLREAYEVWSAIESPDDPNAIRALENLVRALTRWGRYSEGIIAGQRAVALRERAEGRESPDLVPTLVALGINQGFAGDHEPAEQSLLRALELAEFWHGPEDRQTRAVWDTLGWLAWQRGDYERALDIHQSLLDVRLEAFGSGHLLTAFSRFNTALALGSLGDFEAADPLMLQAEVTFERIRGPKHRSTARALHYLGLIRWHLGDKEDALTYLERALSIRRGLYPDTHPDVQRSRAAVETLRLDRRPPPLTSRY
ncbi:MAG: serine/threonine-protein kinase [Xanthomonadales bacterium]|jgi:non-specific serine/threonine protein kinase/serine/threonine-protein kinase|nr:serine/threonine-protein kinase [Xanthomonadales bacterium]